MQPSESCVFNHPVVMSCLIIALIIIILAFLACRYWAKKVQVQKEMAEAERKHELAMKKETFEQEKFWHSERKVSKDDELGRKIKEFEELTVRQKILEKIINQNKDEEIEDLKKAFEELKKKFDSLDGEIEQIIIKKKQ